MGKNLYFRSNSFDMQRNSTSDSTVRFKHVKLALVPLALLGVLWACSGEDSNKDDQFCKCMQVGDELNKFSAGLLERQATAEDEKKIIKLREQSKKECSRYYKMSGQEMLKKKEACKK
jgi:hypothetical protein